MVAPAKPSPAVGGAPISLNFEEAPIAEVVRTILGDLLRVDYVLYQPINGTVTLSTRAPVSADQAVYLLESALFANGLALTAQQTWVGPHTLRWQYLTSLYLQMPMDEVQQQQHQQAVQSARNHGQPDLWHPAEALLWPWGEGQGRGEQTPTAPSAEDLQRWRKHCAQLLAEPSPFSNALHLTTCARDALAACGMRRVMLLMADRTQSNLRVHQTWGLPKDSATLQLAVGQSSVLQRLLAQPAQLRLTPANHAQFCAHLPQSLRALFDGEHLLLRSLVNKGKVVMLLVADQGGGAFADISVQAFGKTAQCIDKALNSYSAR